MLLNSRGAADPAQSCCSFSLFVWGGWVRERGRKLSSENLLSIRMPFSWLRRRRAKHHLLQNQEFVVPQKFAFLPRGTD